MFSIFSFITIILVVIFTNSKDDSLIYIATLITIFVTSLLSGVFGMAGGLVLMFVLLSLYSVPVAMVLHGLVQLTANGSRCFILRSHIITEINLYYFAGSLVALITFTLISFAPEKAYVLIMLGLFPNLMKLALKFWHLDIRNKNSAIGAGFMMTSLQLLAGVSGPALDVFYQNSKLSRFEIVANKALSQTISHLFKCIFYISLVSINNHFPSWLLGVAAILAIIGTRMGTTILAKWNETSFTRYTNKLVTGVSFICIVQGTYLLAV